MLAAGREGKSKVPDCYLHSLREGMNSCAVGFLVFSSPHQKKASIKPIYFFF